MVSIDDEAHIDALFNPAPHVPQDRMSYLNENEAVASEMIEIQTDDSSNTSMSDSSSSGSEESSNEISTSGEGEADVREDEANTEVEEIPSAIPLSTPSTSTPIAVAQVFAQQPTSFENLTVPVAILVNPPRPFTIYVGVTSSGFSIHDLARKTPNLGESSSDGDFVLKNNIAERFELSSMQSMVDLIRFRMKIIPEVVSMSDYFIPVPMSHFLNGLRFSIDPAFAFFLNFI